MIIYPMGPGAREKLAVCGWPVGETRSGFPLPLGRLP
jgi:hypothetical protein